MLTEDKSGPFERRELDPELAATLGASFQNGAFRFQYRDPDTGEPLFQKIKTQDKRFWVEPRGANLVMWGLDAVPLSESRPAVPLVICEGEEDRISLIQVLGDEAFVVSVPNGVAGKRTEEAVLIKDDHRFGYLWTRDFKLHPKIEQFDKVILAVDGDDMGCLLRDELALRIGETRCWHVPYPQGCKDANDVLMRYGSRGVEEVFRRAQPLRPGHLVSLDKIPDRRGAIAYSTGFGFLDKHIMVVRPELMVVTGVPGSGKGQFTRCLAGHLAEAHGWRTAFFAPEDPPYRIRRDLLRFAMRKSRDGSNEDQDEARRFIDQHFMISTPPEDEAITTDMVMAEMEAAALLYDCQVFILDPWNEVDYEPLSGESETKNVERLLVKLKQKARRLNLLLIIVAHPRKPQQGESVNLYSISGSANWFNKSDHGLVIHRPIPGRPSVSVTVEKSKDHETMGIPGAVWMEFRRDKCDYEPGERPEDPRKSNRKQGSNGAEKAGSVSGDGRPHGDIRGVDGATEASYLQGPQGT